MKKNIFKIIALLIIVTCLCGCGSEKDIQKNESSNNKNIEETKEEENNISIVDLNNNLRPYAVMINNNKAARPVSGLSDAFIVYEIMVEGGITRMMALFTQDKNIDKIGSIRSVRHNYLDYAMENNAILVHWGDSIYANEDIKKLNIDHIDGFVYGGTYFKTDKSLNRSLEHTRFTSTELIKKGVDDLKISNTNNNGYLLSYTSEEVDLSKKENSINSSNITIKYSNYQTTSYKYNEDEKKYDRFMSGKEDKDLVTSEQYKVKNILIYDVKYTSISNEDHQDLDNIGTGTGYYCTNGYCVKMKWSKATRSDKTKYMYEDGNEIQFNDGNTYIQIYPKSGKATIN